jgi:CubicO group peptidase (beta-lactamase class C family)
MPVARFSFRVAGALAIAVTLACAAATPAPADPSPSSNGWLQYAAPESAGFSSAKLALAMKYADSVQSGAVMIVHRGLVVDAWGDVARKLELHSVRKSVVSALFGIAVDRKEISLDRTLGEMGMDDGGKLTNAERGARVRDLLAARSGVYLPAAYADASQTAERPARGSHAPGTFWFYNNWDFNALGPIYERFADSSLYESLDRRLAKPLGMQDYTPADGYLVYEPSGSRYPAHTIRMSARDLARFGQLFLQDGVWNGKRLISHEWIVESTTPKSETGAEGRGYGYLWWTQRPADLPGYEEVDKRALFYGSGTGGQFVAVVPSDELVVIHRGDTDHGRNVSGRAVWRIFDMILQARTATSTSRAGATPMVPRPLSSQLAPVAPVTYLALTPAMMAELSGSYEVNPATIVRVFEFDRRLFASFPGVGEAELFALSPSEFTIRAMLGVRIVFERDATGRISGFDSAIGPQRFRAVKR